MSIKKRCLAFRLRTYQISVDDAGRVDIFEASLLFTCATYKPKRDTKQEESVQHDVVNSHRDLPVFGIRSTE